MPVSININGKEVDIQQFKNDWALALMSQGIIVRLSLSRWRGTAPLKADELGLRYNDNDSINFMRNYVVLGHEKLLPPKIKQELNSIEANARLNLKEYSFDTVWGKFIPYSAFDAWEAENNKIKESYIRASISISEKYDEIIQTIKEEYRKMAKDVWIRLYHNQGNPTESFVENFISNIIAKIPSRTDLVASFKYDMTYFIIPMPSMIAENITRASGIARDRENKEIENNIQNNTKARISEEYFKRKQELIDSFLNATVSNLRTHISELCEEVLMSIRQKAENNDIGKTQLNRIKDMISKVKLLNFYNDEEINKILSDLKEETDKFKGDRNKDVIVEKLQKIVEIGKKEFLPKDFNPTIGFIEV